MSAMEYVQGWRDLNAAARTIREVLERQLSITAVWSALTDDERSAVLDHTSNNLGQLVPVLGEIDEPPCVEHHVQPCHEDDCACGERACVRRSPTAEHAAVRR